MNWPLKQAQLWARENTPKDALFLTYPDAFGFRVFSQRASVGEWLDGAGVLWSTEYADYWRDWVQRVGMTLDKRPKEYIWSRIRRGWKAKTGPEIEAIAAHYGADYLLLSKPSPQELEKGVTLPEWRGEVVYENDSVVIYTVPADLVAPGESGQ
jgi:glycine/D-amino acid oxidase-like deaminating enzyme